MHKPRDPRCNIQLQTSFFKPKDSFMYPILDCVFYRIGIIQTMGAPLLGRAPLIGRIRYVLRSPGIFNSILICQFPISGISGRYLYSKYGGKNLEVFSTKMKTDTPLGYFKATVMDPTDTKTSAIFICIKTI